LERYEEVTTPLLEHYARRGLLWTVQGKTSDEITPKLDTEIMKRFG
jgi:adenylate kinase